MTLIKISLFPVFINFLFVYIDQSLFQFYMEHSFWEMLDQRRGYPILVSIFLAEVMPSALFSNLQTICQDNFFDNSWVDCLDSIVFDRW